MLKLEENEEFLMLIRRHWFVMTKPMIVFFFLLIAPSLLLSILPSFLETLGQELVNNITNFLLSIYILSLLLFLFIIWADYYLDIWIITTKRIIDIEQRGLFDRSISEFSLANVQDVTIEISGVIPTLLKFGNLRVQTASENNFVIKDAPRLYEAKDFILKYAEAARHNPRLP